MVTIGKRMVLSLVVSFLLVGVMSLATVNSNKAYAATPAAKIGIVDYKYLIDNHPDTLIANATLKAVQDAAKKEYTDKSAKMNDADKKALDLELGQQVEQKRLELLKPILDKVNAAIKQVADSQGISVVIGKSVVIYGGVDITNDVLQLITGK